MRVRVFVQHAPLRLPAKFASPLVGEPRKKIGDVEAVPGNQDLAVRLQERVNPLPCVREWPGSIRTGPCFPG